MNEHRFMFIALVALGIGFLTVALATEIQLEIRDEQQWRLIKEEIEREIAKDRQEFGNVMGHIITGWSPATRLNVYLLAGIGVVVLVLGMSVKILEVKPTTHLQHIRGS